jgi:hypothetical protein
MDRLTLLPDINRRFLLVVHAMFVAMLVALRLAIVVRNKIIGTK